MDKSIRSDHFSASQSTQRLIDRRATHKHSSILPSGAVFSVQNFAPNFAAAATRCCLPCVSCDCGTAKIWRILSLLFLRAHQSEKFSRMNEIRWPTIASKNGSLCGQFVGCRKERERSWHLKQFSFYVANRLIHHYPNAAHFSKSFLTSQSRRNNWWQNGKYTMDRLCNCRMENLTSCLSRKERFYANNIL